MATTEIEPGEGWWENHYHCADCNVSWIDTWSCQCDDECPSCGKDYSPEKSIELDPETGEPLELEPSE